MVPTGRIRESQRVRSKTLAVPPGFLHLKILYRPDFPCFPPNYVAHVTCPCAKGKARSRPARSVPFLLRFTSQPQVLSHTTSSSDPVLLIPDLARPGESRSKQDLKTPRGVRNTGPQRYKEEGEIQLQASTPAFRSSQGHLAQWPTAVVSAL